MLRPQGYATTVEPGKATVEEDTFTCGHCNSIVFVKAGASPDEMGGFCRMCYRHICSNPDCHDGCEPFEKKLEAMERGEKLMKAIGAR